MCYGDCQENGKGITGGRLVRCGLVCSVITQGDTGEEGEVGEIGLPGDQVSSVFVYPLMLTSAQQS